MAVDNGVGISKNTPIKQEHFRTVVNVHLRICKAILYKQQSWINPYYYYFDLNAGPGRYKYKHGFFEEEVSGSPLHFIEMATSINIPYKATFFEKDPQNVAKLRESLKPYEDGSITVHEGDHEVLLPRYFDLLERRKRYGLVYADPTGSLPPFGLLAEMAKVPCYDKLDFLVYCAATNIKRVQHFTNKTLVDHLDGINKKFWVIREPKDRHQWTFLLGTNWDAMPDFRKIGFYNAHSPEGLEILTTLNNVRTQEEPEEATNIRPNLFDYYESYRTTKRHIYYRGLAIFIAEYYGRCIYINPEGAIYIRSTSTQVDDSKHYDSSVVEDFGSSPDDNFGVDKFFAHYTAGIESIREKNPLNDIEINPDGSVTIVGISYSKDKVVDFSTEGRDN